MLVIENAADDCVPQPHARMLLEAAGSRDKSFHLIEGATHFYAGQPELLDESVRTVSQWLASRQLLV